MKMSDKRIVCINVFAQSYVTCLVTLVVVFRFTQRLLLWYLQTVLILSDITTRKVLEFPVLLDFESILNVNKSIECDKYTIYAE
jgi:hypothetical protein